VKGLTHRWFFRGRDAGDAPAGGRLVHRVLAARGLTDQVQANAFLKPALNSLHDPSLMPDLDKAAGRLVDAARAGEPIVVYGDYDVDGITASAILFHTLRAVGAGDRVSCYVPHRLEEGYGLNAEALRTLAAAGAKVVVSVDCGVTAVGPALAARDAGLELIITDHHHPPARVEDLPEAFAVVHPARPDSTYPFRELSGAGVAYKLAWRVLTLAAGRSKLDPEHRSLLVELLAFAALGSIADVVPLVGENRVIASYGLVRTKHSPFVGLRALVEASGLAGENVGAMDVGFKLGPRLNAAGRIDHAKDAVELFTVASPERAREIAEHLSTQNDRRRAVERAIFQSACERAEAAGMTRDDRRAIVLADESWHAGVVGIVCSRLVEKYGRPAILLARGNGVCHGSGRSIDGFDLHAGLRFCAMHLDKFGGHAKAAGLQVADSKFDAFVETFTAYACERIGIEDLRPRVEIDAEASTEELTVEAVEELGKLEPCGAGNPGARVLLRGLRVADHPRLMGGQGAHLGLHVRGSGGAVLRTVAWGWGERAELFRPGAALDAVVKPGLSYFTGRATVELELVDAAIAGVEKPKVTVRLKPVPAPAGE
jgi:single-stranded-DNA-specific exonuclease